MRLDINIIMQTAFFSHLIPQEETGREYIPDATGVPDYDPELRSALKLAKMTLSEYKKKVEHAIEVIPSIV